VHRGNSVLLGEQFRHVFNKTRNTKSFRREAGAVGGTCNYCSRCEVETKDTAREVSCVFLRNVPITTQTCTQKVFKYIPKHTRLDILTSLCLHFTASRVMQWFAGSCTPTLDQSCSRTSRGSGRRGAKWQTNRNREVGRPVHLIHNFWRLLTDWIWLGQGISLVRTLPPPPPRAETPRAQHPVTETAPSSIQELSLKSSSNFTRHVMAQLSLKRVNLLFLAYSVLSSVSHRSSKFW
jgi:hypothetical protein